MDRIATVTVDALGSLTDDSTLTIDGATVAVPALADSDSMRRLAHMRIATAAKGLGYRVAFPPLSTADGVATFSVVDGD